MNIKKIITVFLTVIMLLSMLPANVFAEGECTHLKGYKRVPRVEPTCSDNGNIEYKECKHSCGYLIDTEGNPITLEETIIPATGKHTPDENNICTFCGLTVAHQHKGGTATCISKAQCDECGEVYGDTDKNNHQSDETVILGAKASTCITPGYTGDTYFKCCNELKASGEAIPVKEHKESFYTENEKAPTCGQNGSYDKVIYCTECEAVLRRETIVVPMTGEHSFIIEAEGTRIASTCTERGSVTMKCLCSAEKLVETEIDPEAHKWGEWTTVKNPTCTENGTMERVCMYNASHKETKEITADGHKAVKFEKVDSTCSSDGNIEYYYCEVCSKSFSDSECENEIQSVIIGKKEHIFTRYISNNDATCVEDGTLTAVCDGCNTATDTITDEGSKLFAQHKPDESGEKCSLCSKALLAEHIWSEDKVELKPASCNEDGLKAVVCTRCGEIKIDTKEIIPSSGHNHTEEWQVILPSDCQQNGVKIKICRNCFEVLSEIIPKNQHNYSDGICVDCGFDSNPKPEPEKPDEPTAEALQMPAEPSVPDEPQKSDSTADCDCACHKNGIEGFFFDVLNFFYKIFGINRTCKCGISH